MSEAQVGLTKADIDLIIEELMTGYLAGRMDNITYYDIHSKLFQGYRQLARAEAKRQIKAEVVLQKRLRNTLPQN